MDKTTQIRIVLDYLKEHGKITSMEAFDFGITRLSAIIFKLRKRGYVITTERVQSVNRYGGACNYGVYHLVQEAVA